MSESAFITSLASLLTKDPLREKILLAPSQRVGRQWLDGAAMLTGCVANVRAMTIKRLLLDCADPVLRKKGLRPATQPEKLRLAALALARLGREHRGGGYFTRLPASFALAGTILSTLEELSSAGVSGGLGIKRGVASKEKAEELAELERMYRVALGKEKLAGPAEIVRAATAGALERKNAPVLLVPEAVSDDFTPMEWGFLSNWPGPREQIFEDRGEPSAQLHFISADSTANEAREVLRRIQESGKPLDEFEVVCLDGATYIPALVAAGLETFGGSPEDLPFTVADGLPAGYARPARLLAAWTAWLQDGLPPEGLARIIEAGLLGRGWQKAAPEVAGHALAARLRELPITGGYEEYRRHLAAGSDSPAAKAEAWTARLLAAIVPLSPDGGAELSDAREVLRAAGRALETGAEGDGKLDAYARVALTESIAVWQENCDWPGFDACAWLAATLRDARVMGLGPRPGRLHISTLTSGGGAAGRPGLFVLGLDDTRHPGAVRQDPVLLDRERPAISPHLVTSQYYRERREKLLQRLLARARGTVWLCHARHDAGGERELFPAPVYNALAGNALAAGALAAGKEPERTSLLPDADGKSLCRRDDWLRCLAGSSRNTLTPADLAKWHPHLAAGHKAVAARQSGEFTIYDGRVPEAGEDFCRENWVLSPTDMETLAKCPLDFFFKRVLGIAPPERYSPTPGRWLDGNERGSLLHGLLQQFLGELIASATLVGRENLGELLEHLAEMLGETLSRWRRRKPATDVLAYRREEEELILAARIFLREETLRQAAGRPLRLEAALGGAKVDDPPWSRAEPVEIAIADGKTLRLKGRIDRVDRACDNGGLVIYDYKTARANKYSRSDPFQQGRTLQPYLYVRMLETALQDAGADEPVRGFSYLFPMPRDEGREIHYSREALRQGGDEIVTTLVGLLRSGLYPLSDKKEDLAFSNYAALHGEAAAAAARRKTQADADLEDWANLRGLGI